MSRNHSAPSTASAPVGDLAQLVAMEQELEQRLARARVEANALVDTAIRDAEAEAGAFDAKLAATRERRRADLEQEKRETRASILAEGRRRAEWYDHVPEATLIELAGWVVDQLVARGGR